MYPPDFEDQMGLEFSTITDEVRASCAPSRRGWADAAIAASTLALALMMISGYDAVGLIFATMAIRSAGAGIQTPAVASLLPQITPIRHLMRVNGVRYIVHHAFVRWLLVLFAIIFVLTVAPSNLTPLMLVRSFPAGETQDVVNLAVLEVTFSIGMMLGGILVATFFAKSNRMGMIVSASLVFGVLSIGLGLSPNVWVFFGFMFLVGLAVPFFSTSSMTLLQETVEPERQGRVFGFVGIVMALAMPFGMAVFGPLADLVPIEALLVASGVLTFAVVVEKTMHAGDA